MNFAVAGLGQPVYRGERDSTWLQCCVELRAETGLSVGQTNPVSYIIVWTEVGIIRGLQSYKPDALLSRPIGLFGIRQSPTGNYNTK